WWFWHLRRDGPGRRGHPIRDTTTGLTTVPVATTPGPESTRRVRHARRPKACSTGPPLLDAAIVADRAIFVDPRVGGLSNVAYPEPGWQLIASSIARAHRSWSTRTSLDTSMPSVAWRRSSTSSSPRSEERRVGKERRAPRCAGA